MDGDSIKAIQAGLAPAQAKALQALAYALAHARDNPPQRWHQSRRGDVHICLAGANGSKSEFVAGVQGEILAFRNGRGEWINDPGTPTARLIQCTELITSCVERSPKSIDRCVADTPVCSTPASGGCCPRPCKQTYRDRRDAGSTPIAAFDEAFVGPSSCVPGHTGKKQSLEMIN